MIHFGKRIKTLRLQRNMSQLELAKALAVTKSGVSAYETGARMPSYSVLIKIAQFFNVSTDYLLGLDEKDGVDLSGLTAAERDAIINLIRAMKKTI